MSIIDEIKDSFREGSVLTKLIYANVGIFVVIRLLQAFYSLSSGNVVSYPILAWFSVPSDIASLLLRPWTLLTYMFLHYEFLHILSNMLCLYWFGRLFMLFFDGRQLLRVYVLGGLCGAVLFIVGYHLIPALYPMSQSGMMMGASASVMAVLFTVTRYAPNFMVTVLLIGQIRLKYLALAYFIFDIISIPGLQNAGGHLAHIGGALFGFLLGYLWSTKGRPQMTVSNNSWLDMLPWRRKNLKIVHKRPLTDMEYNYDKTKRSREVDRILEKVKSSGYESLTKEEKRTLFDASKN